MRAFVGITDYDWYRFLSSRPALDEVNFWQPGGSRAFRALSPGEPFLFKLHAPNNYVVGGGFFAHFSLLPLSLAWQAFGEKNGAISLVEMRERVEAYRRIPRAPHEDYHVGCIILEQPFFIARPDWISVPPDFHLNTQVGKRYDLSEEYGRRMWEAVKAASVIGSRARVAEVVREWVIDGPTIGEPVLTRRRLGQGAFRVVVTDTFERRCAVTRERTLPVLEAAHIRPVSVGGQHRLTNGLLLRSDLHRLFDLGYVTVTPDYRFRVSPRLRKDFENGRDYYALERKQLWLPMAPELRPSRAELEWHQETIFKR